MIFPEDFINKIHLETQCNFEILKQLPNNSIDLICIDPPYLTTKEKWDKHDVVTVWLSKELLRVAKESCSLYIWCGIGEKSQSLIRWFSIFNNDWYFKDLITWKKQRGIGVRKGWLYTREELLWFVKNNKQFYWNKNEQYGEEKRVYTPNPKACKSDFKRLTNVWTDINESTLQGKTGQVEIRGHFTPKPIKAIERIIKVSTKPNDIVLDCFMGSGATALAAKKLNRNFIGMEIYQEYIDTANKRLMEVDKNE